MAFCIAELFHIFTFYLPTFCHDSLPWGSPAFWQIICSDWIMDPAPGHNPVSESHDLIQNAICWSNFYNFRMHSPYLDHKQLSFTKCHFYHLATSPDVLLLCGYDNGLGWHCNALCIYVPQWNSGCSYSLNVAKRWCVWQGTQKWNEKVLTIVSCLESSWEKLDWKGFVPLFLHILFWIKTPQTYCSLYHCGPRLFVSSKCMCCLLF